MTNFEPQLELKPLPKIPLPQGWSDLVLLALLHVVTLARFDCQTFCNWCQAKCIKIRFGKIGEHGSIARVERFHRSMKDECTRRIIVPTSQSGLPRS